MVKKDFDINTDVAIVGAGPAGSTTSLFLAKHGIRHLIFDKAKFPRDKICGDGLSGKVVSYLKQIDEQLVYELHESRSAFLNSWGVRFVSPDGDSVNLPFTVNGYKMDHAPGFVTKRIDFDHFLVQRIDSRFGHLHENHTLTAIDSQPDGVVLTFLNGDQERTVKSKMAISAEGDHSLIARKLAGYQLERLHYFAGLRAYFKNVKGLSKENYIELHFLKETLPGYFWIFPLPDNEANVGIAMLSRNLRKHNVKLKALFTRIIRENPLIKERFAEAQQVDKIRGWGLPLGSRKRPLSGDRFLLTGDAGALIDPFTGEGIGNAMLSGKAAAEAAAKAVADDDFSAQSLRFYDQLIQERLRSELRLSYIIQHLVRIPWLFNFVIRRVSRNPSLQDTFSAMFNDLNMRSKLRSPAFYFRLLKS